MGRHKHVITYTILLSNLNIDIRTYKTFILMQLFCCLSIYIYINIYNTGETL